MANLKEIRSRISSVASTMQITSAMKMVSAAKLKRAQDAIIRMRPYANKLTEILQNLSSTLDVEGSTRYSSQREVKNLLLVTITSNRGLCGGFNASIIKSAENIINNKYKSAKVDVLSIGKKSSEYFSKSNTNINSVHDYIYNDVSFEKVSIISEAIIEQFVDKKYDKVLLVYNQFKNAATQIVINEKYLPISNNKDNEKTSIGEYLFEPKKEEIVEQIIPKSLKTQLFKAILDSHAAEHGARMTAMHKATDNAGELKKELTLTYNKARQAAITGEILEIVGGAEALND